MITLPDVKTMCANILTLYSQANQEEIEQGFNWYSEARQYCRQLACEYSLPLPIVASVLATLSPNCSWAMNKADCRRTIEAYKQGTDFKYFRVATYMRNKVKAWHILHDSDLSQCRGQKVTAFRACILSPYSRQVCIDSHAYCIAVGREYTTQSMPVIRPKDYKAISMAYRTAASDLKMAAYRLQAIVWVTRRRLLNGTHNQFSLPLR